MKWICLPVILAVLCAGCGSNPLARPFVAQSKTKGTKPKPVPKVDPKVKAESKPTEPRKKAMVGKVTFRGLTRDELGAFRVIPESGRTLIVPKNQTYDQVDGFWWRGSVPGEWFKIPDSSEAWIGKAPAPEKFDGTAHRGELHVFYRSNPLVHFVGLMKNGVKHPGWVPDAGQTRSPVSSPWGGGL